MKHQDSSAVQFLALDEKKWLFSFHTCQLNKTNTCDWVLDESKTGNALKVFSLTLAQDRRKVIMEGKTGAGGKDIWNTGDTTFFSYVICVIYYQ